ncbi:hypothetical protein DOTSEDRAFT_53146 [Dothistroma septosporum NZE10]|uniref:Uncharacterized protein n=1 Tax=Dothistroma septosporum (strain NZE10 / CBS 128990) TaxID=675120 RepID=N1PLH2_DOTSN|nr:hypothetical protein DOTSEDRAFT_53146 [Dothistroma septosporum NZE10]
MVASSSNLSSYGYDMVVSATQASLNSTLWEWLYEMRPPVSYVCFLQSSTSGSGQPLAQITLDKLKSLTGGVNPFEIPDNTPQSDPRIAALNNVNFAGGFKMQVGLPPGFQFTDLPIVLLGTSASSILFTMYCSQLSVVQNLPGAWSASTQPEGAPWSVRTTVALVAQDLDVSLNVPYYQNAGLKHRDALLAKLDNLKKSGDPFSLQQLLFNFEQAKSTTPSLSFGPGGPLLLTMIAQSFVPTYVGIVEQHGSPPLSVKAMTPASAVRPAPSIREYSGSPWFAALFGKTDIESDPSQLALTSLNWEVSPPANTPLPTPASQDATTLNYLCAVNNHQLPPPAAFSWNWVEPQDVGNESGVVAINRHVIANHILQEILPNAIQCCVNCSFSDTAHWQGWASYYWTLTPGAQPEKVLITPSGPNVVQISYSPDIPSHVETDQLTTASIQILPTYTCDVTFEGNIIRIVQHMAFRVYVRLDSSSETRNVVDKTITDEYTLSVNQHGSLQTTRKSLKPVDHSESPGGNWLTKIFTNIDDLMGDIKKNITAFAATQLKPIPFDSLQNFIFPGGRVFAFKNATFSTNQDLVCAITYVDPTAAHKAVKPDDSSTPQNSSAQPTVAPGFPVPSGTDPTGSKPDPLKTDTISANGHSHGSGHKDSVPTKPIPSTSGTTTSNGQSSGTADFGTYSLTYSSELIQNYVQGEIVSPQAKFEAVQTSDGHTILFSISTSGVFTAIQESSGTCNNGWVRTDLSTASLQGSLVGATVRTFDVGQSALDGTIGMAMAVSAHGSDNLFVALSNASSNTSWVQKPSWVACPFDAPNESRSSISIFGIFFTETVNKQEYLIVDIDRSSSSAVKDIERYYIDPTKASGTYWVRHDVPVDIQGGNYQSCVGRKAEGLVDGIYTAGKAGTSAQLVYTPIINSFGNGPPSPSRFSLPHGVAVTAMAAARNESQNPTLRGTTDLFAIGDSTLYCLDAGAQRSDGASGKAVLTNALLSRTSQLIVMTHDGVTTLWGRNASDVVYYTSCLTVKAHSSGSWSIPTPVLSGIENLAAYVNRSDGGNTIFAAGGGKLQKLVQATSTTSKLWQAQSITVAAPPAQPSLKIKSYTTSLQLQGANKAAASGVSVALSAKSRSPVYINGLYYVLGPVPITVPADNNGHLLVVEAITKVNGTIIRVSVGGAAFVSINPMEKSFNKLAALNTSDALKSATIPQGTTAGGIKGPAQAKPFVSPSVPSDNIDAAASSMSSLKQAYDGLNSPGVPAAVVSRVAAVAPTRPLVSASGSQLVEISPGNLFQWGASMADNAFDSAIQIVHDAASDTWSFITNIAGQVYSAVLDTVETVVAAVEWVLNKIETIIDDILLFLELLLSWDDITRTKNVMCNLIKLYIKDLVTELPKIQPLLDSKIADLESAINSWSGVKDWPTLGSSGAKPLGAGSSSAASNLTAAGHMFVGHFTNNASSMTATSGGLGMSVAQTILQDLSTALEQEGQVVEAIAQQVQTLMGQITTMSADDVFKRLIGILADAVLSSVQVVMDCLLKVLCQMSDAMMEFLEMPVYIPILSDILSELGVSGISFLELLCWIAAIVTTLAYKILHGGEAPFTDDALPGKIAAAPSVDSLVPVAGQASHPSPASSTSTTVNKLSIRPVVRDIQPVDPQPVVPVQPSGNPPFKNADARHWFTMGHGFAGVYQLIRTITQPIEALSENPPLEISAASILPGGIAAISSMLGNMLGLQEPEDAGLRWSARAFGYVTVGQMFLLSSFAIKKYGLAKPGTKWEDPRSASSGINALLCVPSLICSGLHLQEIKGQSADDDKVPARLDEASNMVGYLGRWMYCVVVNPSTDDVSKTIALVLLCVANVAVTGLQMTEGFDQNI